MTFWLDLFTGATWQQFQDAGSNVSGFTHRQRSFLQKVKPGDVFLCYLTGVMRWVGALEIIGPSKDKRPIWGDGAFPTRFDVKPIIELKPEFGIPMKEFEGKVEFYRGPKDAGKFKGRIRGSLGKPISNTDGFVILELLKKYKIEPKANPVDPKKLAKVPLYLTKYKIGKKQVDMFVSVPGTEERKKGHQEEINLHTEMQYLLIKIGGSLGLKVWIARNDRSRSCNGISFQTMTGVITSLPTQFNEITQRTIELIDVLWLEKNQIMAAFEVESTTSIYSGLLRMSDLLSLQPNLDMNLFIVAPDDRREKVQQEILRPTFNLRDKPLNNICGYISFSRLKDITKSIEALGNESVKPSFAKRIAEYFHEK